MSESESIMTTEAGVVAALATAAEAPQEMDPAALYVYRGEVVDLEKFCVAPHRTKGMTRLHDDASFSAFTKLHQDSTTSIYADLYTFDFVSVFNGATPGSSGWGDHTAELTLKATPEWAHWSAFDGQMLSQEHFAEHIETGADEVVKPSAAEMLELAQSFQANNKVSFKQAIILSSGERQFQYEETIAAKAGQTGKMTIPKEFELGIRPFEGTDHYKVVARLRYRLSNGVLTLGYKLDRPEVVQRAAFDDVKERIGSTVNLSILSGLPAVGV